MKFFNIHHYFLALSALATYLLWGVSLWNGTVKELIRASWYGEFEDGQSFKTKYTGIFVIDFPISLLVAFFFFGTNGHNQSYQYFLIDAYSTLQSAFVWLYVESGRETAKPYSVANPIIWGLLWQGFGAAISLPLYYHYHLSWLEEQPLVLPSVPVPVAKSIPLSFVVGALIPAIIGMLPTWVDRPPQLHQTILAVWQLDPVYVSIIQATGVILIGLYNSTKATKEGETRFFWIRFSYLLAAVSSATGHLSVYGKILTSHKSDISLSGIYVPHIFAEFKDGIKLVDGPWLFLQYDLIIIALSSLSWAYVLVTRLSPDKTAIKFSLILWLLLGSLVLGPGATVSSALFWREGELQRRRLISTRRVRSQLPKEVN